jgi:NitT/TauT family transport system permease protein
MRESKLNGLFFLLALLLVWELAAQAEWVNPLIVPPVTKVVGTFLELLGSGQIPLQILASLKRAAVGYVLAATVFIPLGILMGLFDAVRDALEVSVEMLRPVPPPVVIPQRCYFRLGRRDEIFVIFFSCAWPILLNTLDGVRNIDRVLLYTARTLVCLNETSSAVILPASSRKS